MRWSKECRERLIGDLTAVACGAWLLALLDACLAWLLRPGPPGAMLLVFPGSTLGWLPAIAWPAGLVALVRVLVTPRMPRGWSLATELLTAFAFTVHAWLALVAYAPFRKSVPLLLIIVAAGALLASLSWFSRMEGARRLSSFVAVIALLAGLLCSSLGFFVFRFHYPTLHHVLILVACALVFVSGIDAARWMTLGSSRLPLVTAVLLPVTLAVAALRPEGRPYFLEYSQVGRLVPFQEDREPVAGDVERIARPDDEAASRFRSFSQYPSLPSDFRMERFDLLLVVADAARFSDTSLAVGGHDTTPHLRKLARESFVAERAYSPASGTLWSMSALLTMKYPSAVALTTWMRPWYGELAASETTVTELLAGAGYETFWVGYNPYHVFGHAVLGLEQGFSDAQLVPEEPGTSEASSRDVDLAVANLAIARLERLAHARAKGASSRFFGWVLFGGPHAPYMDQGHRDLPRASEHDRYLQELRTTDAQLARVLDALRRLGLESSTIVVVLGDHGEEFGEHGAQGHSAALYAESLHVPLVVRIPGIAPHTASLPTSTLYLFPWLLMQSDVPELRGQAELVLRNVIGPMLRATSGAVVAETLGHDRVKATLIYPERKTIYDFRSGLSEVYQTDEDREERNDVYHLGNHDDLARRFAKYRSVREALRKYGFEPSKVERLPPFGPAQRSGATGEPAR